MVMLSVYVFGDLQADYTVKAKLSEADGALRPLRVRAAEHCSAATPLTRLNRSDLGLSADDLRSTLLEDVALRPDGASAIEILVTHRRIDLMVPDSEPPKRAGVAVDEGATLIFRGECVDGKMAWSVAGGTVPQKYWPRL